jgi:hypothetical protein
MSKITDEQRLRYQSAAATLERAEAAIQPVKNALADALLELERPRVAPARAELEAIIEEIGDEPIGNCIFCDKVLFSEDDYVSGDEYMCAPCNEEAWASLSPEERAERIAEIETEDAGAPR